jgi:D-alanyl-D-alanine dipeptidase
MGRRWGGRPELSLIPGEVDLVQDVVLMADPRVAATPVEECGEPLCDLRDRPGLRVDGRLADAEGAYAHVRSGVAERLVIAQRKLPPGLSLLVVEGYRPLALQIEYFNRYAAELRRSNAGWSEEHVRQQASRSLAPPEIGPHVCGAAIDLTLCISDGTELPMGSDINASPEESGGACYTAAPGISEEARRNRLILSEALSAAGLVNYPTEWWHWSYGDRYWALATGAAAAIYGQLHWPTS